MYQNKTTQFLIFLIGVCTLFLFQNCSADKSIPSSTTSKSVTLSTPAPAPISVPAPAPAPLPAPAPVPAPVPQAIPCAAGEVNHCALPATGDGLLGGSCASGFTGTCSFSCQAGNWSALSNSCVVAVVPGSQTFSNPGSAVFTVPNFNTLTVTVNGGGGGGMGLGSISGCIAAHSSPTFRAGTSGGDSSFNNSVYGYGGQAAALDGIGYPGAAANGNASGGNVSNIVGGGGAGGAGISTAYCPYQQPAGGSGGKAVITYSPGQLGAVGSGILVIVGGAGGAGNGAANGTGGSVVITWQ